MGRIGEIIACLIIIYCYFVCFCFLNIYLGSFLVSKKNSCFSHSLHLVIEKAQRSAGNHKNDYCPWLLFFLNTHKNIFIFL